ncbi:MAG: leucine-rich repeat domain-containing protein [Clostridia bacterium]|nr:leucine-rich repeat domain-containing protein [Clostridia bacterium]
MKRKLTKILASLLCVVMIITVAPVSGFVGIEIPWLSDLFKIEASAASYYSGTCGENLSWSFNPITGALKITGTGEMTNWSSYTSVPWSLRVFSIKSINIGDSVTSIGDLAFYYCIRVKNITIPDSVTSIGDYAFDGCESLKSVTIPDSVTSIGNSAFKYCKSLTSVTIPDSVTSIGDDAFRYCTNLTSVTIPDSVTSIGNRVFSYCGSLTKITVDTNNKYYLNDEYGVLFNKDKTTLIQYPGGNTRTTYVIPDSVTSIGNYAFAWCDLLTSVTIGNSVTSIGKYAFGD